MHSPSLDFSSKKNKIIFGLKCGLRRFFYLTFYLNFFHTIFFIMFFKKTGTKIKTKKISNTKYNKTKAYTQKCIQSVLYWPATSGQGAGPGMQWNSPVSLGKIVFIYVSNSKPSLERLHSPSVLPYVYGTSF